MTSTSNALPTQGSLNFRGHDFTVPIAVFAGCLISWLVYKISANSFTFPQYIIDTFPFEDKVNATQAWLETNFKSHTRAVANVVKVPLEWLEEILWEVPWVLVLAVFVLPALAYGGLRLALFITCGVLFWGMVDMWYEAMSTLSLMLVSVSFSAAIGIVLGIFAASSDRFDGFLRPVLDTMQTMPAFVYLIPAIFFFGIGAASAAMAVVIYALPPAVRLTNLGIRQVPNTLVEVGQSYGSNWLQMLFKVKLPMAKPSIMLGINQTIMMALGLAVLAVFIGGGGLGEQVWKALTKLKVGWAFEGGVCIVFMAIMFDRLSYAVTGVSKGKKVLGHGHSHFHLLPQKWDDNAIVRAIEKPIGLVWDFFAAAGTTLTRSIAAPASIISSGAACWIKARPFLLISLIILPLLYWFGGNVKWMSSFPSALEVSIREPIDFAVNWLTVHPGFIGVTKALRTFIFLYLLDPLDNFLSGLPWWYVLAALGLIVWVSVNIRFAVVTMFFLVFLGATGLWDASMFTLAGTSVSVALCMIIGVPIGIVAAYSRTIDSLVKPVLDTMQTMPAFVYLIPALFFFGGNKTTAVIATVIYAIPPVIRLTTLGLRGVPTELNEVTNSFGSSTLQTLFKVKLPMASPSIMLGMNQAVVFALAMQAITPLIGGLGLGKEVFDAMNHANMGQGLAAGIGIVLLTILLDRLTQGWNQNQRRALGL